MALTLNGTTQYIDTTPGIATYPFTFACWFKPVNNTGSQVLINTSSSGTFPNDRWSLQTNAGLLQAFIQNSGFSGGGPLSLVPATVGSFNHCVAIFTSRTSRMVYLNGVSSVDVGSDDGGVGLTVTSVGACFHGGTGNPRNFANGVIAFPAVWGMALTPADVAVLYSAGAGADPRIVEPQILLSLLLLSGGTPYLDLVSGATWTAAASPTTGSTDPFTLTAAGSPTLSVNPATVVTSTTAIFHGQMVFTRGANPTIEGFNYGPTPAFGSQISVSGTFTPAAYSQQVTGLTPGTIYYYQAFATNTNGTGTSAFNSFFTTAIAGLYPGTVVADDRMGAATHFDQQGSSGWWNPTLLMPIIAASGCTWIRDDLNHGLNETALGVFDNTLTKPFWAVAKANGLKTCGILHGSKFYTPPFDGVTDTTFAKQWDPTFMAAYCTWVANNQNNILDVLEVTNEPNNAFQGLIGPTWQSQLVLLTNACYTAVQAAHPAMKVIGYGAQGHQILEMLALGGVADGIVYHPYDLNNNVPETNFEPPYLNYAQWVTTLRSTNNTGRWETEFSASATPTANEYTLAIWFARRILLSWWYQTAHTFVYDFADVVNSQCLYDNAYSPRQAAYVLQRFLLAFSGLASTGQGVTLSNLSGGFDSADVQSVVFCNSTTTSMAIWFGNNIVNQTITGTANLAYRMLNTHVSDSTVDSVMGYATNLSGFTTSLVGTGFTIQNFPISNIPQFITVTGIAIASAPLVIGWTSVTVTLTTATLNGQITVSGGSSSTITGFHYGLTTGYGTTVQTTETIATGMITPKTITGLTAGTTYHFQVFATNPTGTGVSSDFVFQTQSLPSLPPTGFGLFGQITSNDILIQSIIRESKPMVAIELADELIHAADPLAPGPVLHDNTPPPEFQNEYLKLYQQMDYQYRV